MILIHESILIRPIADHFPTTNIVFPEDFIHRQPHATVFCNPVMVLKKVETAQKLRGFYHEPVVLDGLKINRRDVPIVV